MKLKSALVMGVIVAGSLTQGPAASGERDRTPPCKYEDGSGQARCVWDARHMGNGEGHSVLIKRGGTDGAEYIRISHRRAHRLMTTSR